MRGLRNRLRTNEKGFTGARPEKHLRLSGSVHTFSSDLRLIPFMSQNARSTTGNRPAEVSSIDPARALMVTGTYLEAFFDQYLVVKTGALLNGPSKDYPEVAFER